MAMWAPARADVIGGYAREVLDVHPRGRLVVGIDGIEPFGAATRREAFAADLAAAIQAEGLRALALPMTGFLAEPLPDDPARLYDEAAFRSRVLQPYRSGSLPGVDADRAVLVVSGPFLHHGDWAGIWHTSAWLHLPRAVAAFGGDAWSALIATSFRRVDARKVANATFDVTDPEHPRRRFEDAC